MKTKLFCDVCYKCCYQHPQEMDRLPILKFSNLQDHFHAQCELTLTGTGYQSAKKVKMKEIFIKLILISLHPVMVDP